MIYLLSKLGVASLWGTVLLLIVWLFQARCPVEIRPYLWRLTWAKMLLTFIPLGAVAIPFWHNYDLSRPATPIVRVSNEFQRSPLSLFQSSETFRTNSEMVRIPSLPMRMNTESESSRSMRPLSLSTALFSLWVLGVSFQLLRLGQGYRKLNLVLKACDKDISDLTSIHEVTRTVGLKKAPQIRISESGSPFLCGILMPTVVIPRHLLNEPAALNMALAHEFSHLKRRDLVWNLLGLMAQIVFWFHPLVHLARRDERADIEAACDAQTLHKFTFQPQTYGALLVQMASKNSLATPLALGISDEFGELKSRLLLLKRTRTARSTLALAVVLFGLMAALALVPMRLVRVAVAAQSDKTTARNNYQGWRPQLADASAIFEGNVSDEKGHPIAGANVYVMREMASGNPAIYQTKSDAGGNFTIKARAIKLDARFSYEIWADAPERGIGFVKYKPKKGVADGQITLDFTSFFRPSFSYNKQWISGVKVQVKRIGGSWGSWYSVPKPILEKLKAVTDPNGEVRFRLPRGVLVQLEHQDPRFAPLFFAANNTENMPPVVTLERRASISGYVRLPDGKPAANIGVAARFITSAEQQGERLPIDYTWINTTTDARGFYRIPNLHGGKYLIMVATENDWLNARPSEYVTQNGQANLVGGEERREDFQLQKGVLLTGQVRSEITGRPVIGQYIHVIDSQGIDHYSVSRAFGGFKFYLLPGKTQLIAHGNDVSPPKGYALPANNHWYIDLKDGYSQVIVLPNAPGVRNFISGKVVDSAGKPVTDVRVYYSSTDKTRDSRFQFVGPKTKADGSFVLGNPDIGQSALIWVMRGEQPLTPKFSAKLGDDIVLPVGTTANPA